MTTTIRVGYIAYAVIYHELTDAEVPEIVTAIQAEAYESLEVIRDVKSVEKP